LWQSLVWKCILQIIDLFFKCLGLIVTVLSLRVFLSNTRLSLRVGLAILSGPKLVCHRVIILFVEYPFPHSLLAILIVKINCQR
jgi:hypothetical protein